jgi:hypothetical protein
MNPPDPVAAQLDAVVKGWTEGALAMGTAMNTAADQLGFGASSPASDGIGSVKVMIKGADLLSELGPDEVLQIELDTPAGRKTVLIGEAPAGSPAPYQLISFQPDGKRAERELDGSELAGHAALIGMALRPLTPHRDRQIQFGQNTVRSVALLRGRGFTPLAVAGPGRPTPAPVTPMTTPPTRPSVVPQPSPPPPPPPPQWPAPANTNSLPERSARARNRIHAASTGPFDAVQLTVLATACRSNALARDPFVQDVLRFPREVGAWLRDAKPVDPENRAIVAQAMASVSDELIRRCDALGTGNTPASEPYATLARTLRERVPSLARTQGGGLYASGQTL